MSSTASPYDMQCHDLAVLCLKGEPRLNTPENVDALARELRNCVYLEIEFMRMRADLREWIAEEG